MAYIIVVNPAILKFAGLPVGASTVATIIVAAAGSILMGVYANRPIAVAPYMGENAFIAFGLAALGVTWQQRLGAVFISGVVFLIITFAGLRACEDGAPDQGEPETGRDQSNPSHLNLGGVPGAARRARLRRFQPWS